MKYLIIGNGIAGIEAALTIRKNNEQAEINVLTKSSHPHYYRPNTIEYLAEYKKFPDAKNKLFIYKEDFLKNKKINEILNCEVMEVDPTKKQVRTKNNESYQYDKLLLATGGNSFKPPISGADLPGIFTLHGINDAEKIIDYCATNKAQKITIIGGGLLGLETANSLHERSLKVTVIEIADRLLPRQLDCTGATLLQKKLEAKGISFIINEKIHSIAGSSDIADKIILHSGSEHQSDAIIISAGISPDLGLAKKTGLESGRGIIVNQKLETSIKNIFAAGDTIELNGRGYGLWLAAKEQGQKAALNMLNQETLYKGTTLAASLKIKGVELFSAGDINNQNFEIFTSQNESIYIKLSLENEETKAVIALGDKGAIKNARKVLINKDYIRDFISEYKLIKN